MNYSKDHIESRQNIIPKFHLFYCKCFWLIFLTILTIITLFYYKINQAFYITSTNANVYTLNHIYLSSINGKIKFIHVENEQYVKAGDLLIEFENYNYINKLANATTNLHLAKEKLDLAKFQKERSYNLYHNNVIAFEDYNDNLIKYNLALAQYNEANLAATTIETSLRNTKVFASYDGWITNLIVRPRDLIKTNEKLLELVKDEKFWIKCSLSKKQLDKIKIGQKVAIKIKNFNNYNFAGIVESKSPLKILITNNKFHFPLRNGMKAEIKIKIARSN